MRLASTLRVTLLVGAVTLAAPAHAGVPSPVNSTLPACIHTTLDGTLITTVVVRDLANNPIANSVVFFDYSNCAEFQPCPGLGPVVDNYTVDATNKRLVTVTEADGKAIVYLRGGGGCATNPFRIFADGVMLGSRPEASTDQNGDQQVNGADVALITAKVGTSDLTGDLTCDGVVDGSDVSIVQGASGKSCSGPVPVQPQSWGRVKILYR